MGIGIGLGGFVQGMASGMQLGLAMRKADEEREVKDQIASAADEVKQKFGDKLDSPEAQAELANRTTSIYTRANRPDDARKSAALQDSFKTRHEEEQTKAGMKAVSDEADKEPDENKRAITKNEGYAKHLESQGKPEEARKFREHAAQAKVKYGSVLAERGLNQIDRKDWLGLNRTLGEIGALKGYGPDGVLGIAMSPDGKPIVGNDENGVEHITIQGSKRQGEQVGISRIPTSVLPQVFARFYAPSADFAEKQAAEKDKTKRAADIKDYGAKKEIDAKHADPQREAKERTEALAAVRERSYSDGKPGNKTKAFDDLPEAQKEAEIQKEMKLRRGPPTGAASMAQPAAPGRAVVVDRATGQVAPVQPPAPGSAPAGTGTPAGAGTPPAKPVAQPATFPGLTGGAPPGRALGLAQQPEMVAKRSAMALGSVEAMIGTLQQMEQAGGLTEEEHARLDQLEQRQQVLVEQQKAARGMMHAAPGLPEVQPAKPVTMSREEYLRRNGRRSPSAYQAPGIVMPAGQP